MCHRALLAGGEQASMEETAECFEAVGVLEAMAIDRPGAPRCGRLRDQTGYWIGPGAVTRRSSRAVGQERSIVFRELRSTTFRDR